MHVPAWQISVPSQAFEFGHGVPSGTGGFVHAPLALHAPAAWHWSEGGHVTVPPHTPAVHTSVVVHVFPSLQLVPFAFAGFVHAPFASQAPTVWH